MVGITRARFMEELVLWMPMTEGAGTLVKDQSKYHNNGAFGPAGAAPSWVVGREGLPGLEFDTDEYVDIPNSPSLDGDGAGTVMSWELWLYHNLIAGDNRTPFDKLTGGFGDFMSKKFGGKKTTFSRTRATQPRGQPPPLPAFQEHFTPPCLFRPHLFRSSHSQTCA